MADMKSHPGFLPIFSRTSTVEKPATPAIKPEAVVKPVVTATEVKK